MCDTCLLSWEVLWWQVHLSRQCSTHVITCQELQTATTAARQPLLPLSLFNFTTRQPPVLSQPHQASHIRPKWLRVRRRVAAIGLALGRQHRDQSTRVLPSVVPVMTRVLRLDRQLRRAVTVATGAAAVAAAGVVAVTVTVVVTAVNEAGVAPRSQRAPRYVLLFLGVLPPRRLTSLRPDCGGAPIQEHQRTAPLRDFRAIRSHQGPGSSH